MFTEIGISDIIDIIIVSFLVYILITWFKRTRAAFILTGIVIIAVIYIIARQLNLVLTSSILQGFFAVILIAFVIIFQEEIRRFFERIARWGISAHIKSRKIDEIPPENVEMLVRTVSDMAKEKTGALIVIAGKSSILGYLNGGTVLDAKLSEEIIKSIFDTHSMGHDGAVVIENRILTYFGAHLPLSKNFKKLGHHGTRHAAALGLSELTDALCIVVSEENGKMSFARHGDLKEIDSNDALARILDRFFKEIYPEKKGGSVFNVLLKNYKEKIMAIAMAIMLWLVYVYGSEVIYKTVDVPVNFTELPASITSVKSDPKKIDIIFSGPRKDIYFLSKSSVSLFIKTLDFTPGNRRISIFPSDISVPKNINVEKIEPSKIDIQITDSKK